MGFDMFYPHVTKLNNDNIHDVLLTLIPKNILYHDDLLACNKYKC